MHLTIPLVLNFRNSFWLMLSSPLWTIWNMRNKVIFEHLTPPLHSALAVVLVSVRKAIALNPGSCSNSVSNIDLKMNLFRAPLVKLVFWFPSNPGWIKLNIDGAAHGLSRKCNVWTCIQKLYNFCEGLFLFSFTCVHVLLSRLSYRRLYILGVNFAWERDWHEIWIESNSSFVVFLLKNKSSDIPWHLRFLRCLYASIDCPR